MTPPKLPDTPVPEIEFAVDLGGGNDQLYIGGSSGPDQIGFAGVDWINLNGDGTRRHLPRDRVPSGSCRHGDDVLYRTGFGTTAVPIGQPASVPLTLEVRAAPTPSPAGRERLALRRDANDTLSGASATTRSKESWVTTSSTRSGRQRQVSYSRAGSGLRLALDNRRAEHRRCRRRHALGVRGPHRLGPRRHLTGDSGPT